MVKTMESYHQLQNPEVCLWQLGTLNLTTQQPKLCWLFSTKEYCGFSLMFFNPNGEGIPFEFIALVLAAVCLLIAVDFHWFHSRLTTVPLSSRKGTMCKRILQWRNARNISIITSINWMLGRSIQLWSQTVMQPRIFTRSFGVPQVNCCPLAYQCC